MAGKTTSTELIAKRYARALYDLAEDKNAVDAVSKDLSEVMAMVSDSPVLKTTLSDKSIDQDDRLVALDALLKKTKFHSITTNFLRVAVDGNRFAIIDEMINQYNQQRDAAAGIEYVHATTAHPLIKKEQDELKGQLKTALDAKGIDLTLDVDPDVLGGIRVRFGSTLVDDTVKNKLNRLSQTMKGIA